MRPLLKPQCEYLLLNRSGSQFQKLTELLSVLVFEAIGKYIHPTRYRQIIETESVNNLDLEAQQLVSEDQKHSSNAARVHYQKLRWDHGRAMDICAQQLRQQDSNGIEVKDMETEGDGDTASSHTSEGEIENNNETLRKSRVKVRFTQEEDNYLRKGIVKFGMRWTAILNCLLYKFEQSRAPTTL